MVGILINKEMKTVSNFFWQNAKVLITFFGNEANFIYSCQKQAKDYYSESSVLEAAKRILTGLTN